jgi:eukaryotic-like serine/threonine-protein kinase
MPKPAFEHVEKLFHDVVELPIERRAAFLEAACGGDIELRAAVDELLRHDNAAAETNSFLASPLTHAAAALRPTQPAKPTDNETPTIPGYQILGDLGRGGMGVVYMARQNNLKRIVALKMLLPAGLDGPEQLARFKSEAELLARIHQPNIIPIYDIGEHNGRPYFTMEFVDGPNLSQFLAGRSQDPVASARLVEVLARAIHAVHEVGIIHRDLKPANVLLQLANKAGAKTKPSPIASLSTATPKITDFGLAKDWNVRRDLTQTGLALGTPSYMAPEQARSRSEELGPATDVYSLGTILYEMLTGRPPFDAATPAETIALLLRDDPLPPTQLKAGLPRDLTTICLRCLEKSPRKRYATAFDLAEDLRRFQAGKPILARPISPVGRALRWCRRHPLAAALAGICGVMAAAFVTTVVIYDYKLRSALAREHDLAERQRHQIVQLDINIAVTRYEAGDTFAAVLLYADAMRLDDQDSYATYRARIAELLRECPRLIEATELGHVVAYARPTAKGIYEAFPANEVLEFHDVLTNRNATMAAMDGHDLRSVALSSDGRWAVRVGQDGTATIVDGQDGKKMTLPNGEGPAMTEVTIHRDAAAMVSSHVDGSKRLWVMIDGRPVARPLPPTTAGFAISDCGKWLLTFDAEGVGQLSEINGVQTKGTLKLGAGVDRAIVSSDAERIVTIGIDQSVRVWQTTTGEGIVIPHRISGDITHAQFSPDGKRVLIADAAGTMRVWDAAVARPVTPILYSAGLIAAVDFQGDGDHLVLIGRSGSVRVWELPGATPSQKGRWDPQCDTQSADELISLIQVLAHRRIDEQQQVTPLAADQLRSIIERVKSQSHAAIEFPQ